MPSAEITWVAPDFLVEHEVGEWMELPLWIVDPALAYADRVDVQRALDEGLTFRPLAETVRGALDTRRDDRVSRSHAGARGGASPEWHGRE